MGLIGLHWTIVIDLPENRDYKGTLRLYDPDGNFAYSCEALGRGSNKPDNDNDHSNWWMPYADTPTGDWYGKVVEADPDIDSFGPYERILLTALGEENDHANIACNTYGRSGFMIHGGDPETNSSLPWYPLRPTYGCIRVRNQDQLNIINLVKSYGGDGLVQVKGPQKPVS